MQKTVGDKLQPVKPFDKIWDRIGREAFWLMLGQSLTALAGLVAIRVLTGLFPKEVYGLSWLFINAVGLGVMLLANPLGQALNRFYHDGGGQEQLDRLLALVWRLQVGVALVVGLTYVLAVAALGSLRGSHWLVYGIMPVYFFFLAFLNMAQLLLNTSRRRKGRVILLVTEAWLKPAGAVAACLLWRPDVNSFVLGYASASIITGVAGMLVMKGYGSVSPFKLTMPDREYAGTVIRYSMPWVGVAACIWALSLSGRYFVNSFMGAAATGTYVATYQVSAALFQLLGGSFGTLMVPIIYQQSAKAKSQGEDVMSNTFRAFAWAGLPVVAVFVVMRVWLMRWLVSPAYWDGVDAIIWIGLGVYVSIMGDLGATAFHVAKKTTAMLYIYVASVAVYALLCLTLIPRIGLVGAGISTFAAYSFYAFWMIYVGRSFRRWVFPLRSFLAAWTILAVTSVVVSLSHALLLKGRFGYPYAAATLLIFCATLGLSAWLFRRSWQRDFKILSNF